MKKKLVISVICIVLTLSAALVAFAACDKAGTTKVSSYSELLSASGNVVLTADIDCNYEPINSFDFTSFDGQGFKIKNFVLKVTGAKDNAAFFGTDTRSIRNVTFDGVSVYGENVLALSVVKIGGGGYIENVHVKNVKITAVQNQYLPCYVGAIYAGAYNAQLNRNTSYSTSYNAQIVNCSADKVSIEIEGNESPSTSGNSSPRLYAGVIAGACDNVSDSYAKNSTVTVTSNNSKSYPIVGGLVGYCTGIMENCYAVDNVLNAYSKQDTNIGNATVSIGGLVGYASATNSSVRKIQYCYSDNNKLNASTNNNVYAGGLVGRLAEMQVGQCYAVKNVIDLQCSRYGLTYNATRNACGLIGYATSSVIVSSFACDNDVTESATTTSTKIAACGFAVVDDFTSVSYCGAANNKLEASTTDEFSHLPIANLYDCIVSSVTLGNVNACQKLARSEWFKESTVKAKLKIGGPYWLFPSTYFPALDF